MQVPPVVEGDTRAKHYCVTHAAATFQCQTPFDGCIYSQGASHQSLTLITPKTDQSVALSLPCTAMPSARKNTGRVFVKGCRETQLVCLLFCWKELPYQVIASPYTCIHDLNKKPLTVTWVWGTALELLCCCMRASTSMPTLSATAVHFLAWYGNATGLAS